MPPSGPDPIQRLPPPAAVHVRLLLPFLFERRSALRAVEALASASHGIARGLWSREGPRRLYRYRLEMTPHLDRLLFAESGAPATRGAFLRASPEETQRWLGECVVELPGGPLPLALDPECGIELFLTAHGAGVLSIAVRLGQADVARALHAVSRLARLTRPGDQAPWLRRGAATAAADGGAASAAASAEPLGVRLASAEGRFALTEVVAQLLEPLRALGLTPIQDAFSAYTVLRFGPELDLADPGARAAVERLVASVAQVDELRHAAVAGVGVGVPHLELGPRHWAAASLQGAAHAVVDPPPREEEDPVPRWRDRFFVPYLAALLQRCAIKKAAEEATEMVLAEGVEVQRVSALRSHVLEFVLAGALPEVSVRSSLHRFYRTCQRATDHRRNLGQLRRALADLEAQLATRQQVELAEAQREIAARTAESLASSHAIHVALEWIEVFIVVAYAAELAKFFVVELPELEHAATRWLAGGLAVLPGAVALAWLRPWRHRHMERARAGRPGPLEG